MITGFIKFVRSEAAEELMRYPASFTLLAQIAFRARREVPKINPFNMEVGEAMIGDHATIGLSRQQFRQALDRLKEAGFITTRATNKGTIAKLCNTDIYDINTATQQPSTQPAREPTREPASNQPGNQPGNQTTTTNKNVKNDNKEKKTEERKNGAPAGQPVSASHSLKFFPDEATVFTMAGFAKFVTDMGYGQIDRGMYLPEIQRKAELMKQERDETGWENFVLDYLKKEKSRGLLVTRELPIDVAARQNSGPAPTARFVSGNYNLAELARTQLIPTE